MELLVRFLVAETDYLWIEREVAEVWFDAGDSPQRVAIRFPALNPLEIGRPDAFPHTYFEDGQEVAVGALVAEAAWTFQPRSASSIRRLMFAFPWVTPLRR
jgi:hypothetical protein